MNTDFSQNDSFTLQSWNIDESNNSLSVDNKDIAVLIAIYPCLGVNYCHIMPKINIINLSISNNQFVLDNIFNFG